MIMRETSKRITAARGDLQISLMISVRDAKKILNNKKAAYNDEQVKEILETLAIMAEQQILTEDYKTKKQE